jgi:hypothetical protein
MAGESRFSWVFARSGYVIKIRYADLPGGLHARAEACGKDTIIYLLPGLTDAQRRAALHRARSSARIGHGPPLPAAGVARAVAADRVRTTLGNALAALRVHLGVSVPLVVIVVSAAIAYALLASGTVSGQSPQASGQTTALGTPVILAPWLYLGIRPRGPARHHRPAMPRHPRPSGVIVPPRPQPSASPSPVRSPSPTPRPTHRPKPAPTSSPTPVSSPTPAPTQTVPGSGSVGHGGGGLCLEFGPTGVCLAV